MDKFLAIIGLIVAFALIKKRETIGNSLGEYEWMHWVGGIYGVIIIIGILIFLWNPCLEQGYIDLEGFEHVHHIDCTQHSPANVQHGGGKEGRFSTTQFNGTQTPGEEGQGPH